MRHQSASIRLAMRQSCPPGLPHWYKRWVWPRTPRVAGTARSSARRSRCCPATAGRRARRSPASTSCWPAAKSAPGTAWRPTRPGTCSKASRSSCGWHRPTALRCMRWCSAPTRCAATWCRPAGGRPPSPRVIWPTWGPRWGRDSISPTSLSAAMTKRCVTAPARPASRPAATAVAGQRMDQSPSFTPMPRAASSKVCSGGTWRTRPATWSSETLTHSSPCKATMRPY